MEANVVIQVAAGITAVVASIFAIQKLYRWMFPLYIEPVVLLWFDNGATPDSIRAKIINKSSEIHYVMRCEARGTYSLWYILKCHLKNPFVKPSLYPNIWYNGAVYSLLRGEPRKLEPFQPIELSCELHDHLLNAMFAPYFIITVVLSSGKKVRSKKMKAPGRWKNIGRSQLRKSA